MLGHFDWYPFQVIEEDVPTLLSMKVLVENWLHMSIQGRYGRLRERYHLLTMENDFLLTDGAQQMCLVHFTYDESFERFTKHLDTLLCIQF